MSPRIGAHRCAAPDCKTYVGTTRLMCHRDWTAVPQNLRDEILRTWDPHGGIRQSSEYYAAVKAAKDALRQQRESARRDAVAPHELCRPVTVEVDGEETVVSVLAEEPMSEEGRAALAEVVAVAKQLHATRPARADICPDCGFPTGTYPHRSRCEKTNPKDDHA